MGSVSAAFVRERADADVICHDRILSNGTILIYDKSAMQRLSADEAEWLTHFFRCNITPVYLREVPGSGLIDYSQKMTVAAMAMAEKKVWAQRS